jgi:GT2 family glycosyltransferase
MVSIVISNYNGLRFGVLQKCLSSVLSITYPNYEVILVDNCSNDGSVEFVRNHFERRNLMVIRNTENNYVKGLNIALRQACGEYILYLNNDVDVDRGFLEPLVETLENDKNVAIVQCKLIDARSGKIDSLGEVIDIFGYFKSLGAGENDVVRLKRPFEIPCTNGSAFIVRRSILLLLGGFDPLYYSGYEDVDMSLRVRSLCYKILTNPMSVVYHARGTTLLSEAMRVFSSYNFQKNRLITLLKFHSLSRLILVMPALVALYMSEFFYMSIVKRKTLIGITRLWALLWAVKNLKHIIRERKKVHMNAKCSNLTKFMSRRPLICI